MPRRADIYRVVRCPNCRNILLENTNISEYPCSKCGRILHAKDRSASGENTDSLAAHEAKNSMNKSKIRSPDTLSVSSRGRTSTSCSSNALLSEVERVNGSCNQQDKGESAITGDGDRESENAFRSTRKGKVPIQVDETENFHAYRGNTGPKLIDESRDFSLRIAPSEVFKSSASRSPRSCDGSASSSDDGSSSRLRKWQQVKSRRTFRQRMMNEKQGKEGSTSGTDTTTADIESNFEDGLLSSKSSNERFQSAELPSSDVSRDEFSFRFGISEVERDTLPGSKDFHSTEAGINLEEGHIFDTCSHGTKSEKSRFDATRLNRRHRSISFSPRYSISRPQLDVWRSESMPNTQKLFSQPSSSVTLPVLENESERSSRIHYYRPILRGAPFIICNNKKCASLLQMPLDFVLSRKRVNKLKCGACFKVLELKFPARSTFQVEIRPGQIPTRIILTGEMK